VPLAAGGTDERENLQGLCKPCHSAKTAREDGRWCRRAVGALLVLALLGPAFAAAEEPAVAEARPARIAPAVWCEVVSEDGGAGIGCDAGVGFAAWSVEAGPGRWASVVGLLGPHSVGLGPGWTFGRQSSVALVALASYDGDGIRSDRIGWGLAATVSLARLAGGGE